MITQVRLLSVFSSAAVLVLAGVSPLGWADNDAIPFADAELFFELNDTDGDLGIHALIDGDGWQKLEIRDPGRRKILKVSVAGRLRQQGLTEFFFESAEPTFDELPAAEFFERFPEGDYKIKARTIDGETLWSTAEITHLMPAPAQPTVNGEPMATECDEEDPDYDITVTSAPVTIAWAPVTMSHPDAEGGGAGVQPPEAVTIHNYEVVVEVELDLNGDEFSSVLSVILPPDVTELTLPETFTGLGDQFKYEVLAREESFNQTAVESCFELEDDD